MGATNYRHSSGFAWTLFLVFENFFVLTFLWLYTLSADEKRNAEILKRASNRQG